MRRWRWLVLGGAMTFVPAHADPATPAELASFPNVTFATYLVTGDTAGAIRASLDAHRPRDPHDGVRVDAMASPAISWRFPVNADGSCDLTQARVSFSALVVLPRLAPSATRPASLTARWNAYLEALVRHEAGHLQVAYDDMASVLNALQSASCASANKAAQAELETLEQRQRTYDDATAHGRTQGAVFP